MDSRLNGREGIGDGESTTDLGFDVNGESVVGVGCEVHRLSRVITLCCRWE